MDIFLIVFAIISVVVIIFQQFKLNTLKDEALEYVEMIEVLDAKLVQQRLQIDFGTKKR